MEEEVIKMKEQLKYYLINKGVVLHLKHPCKFKLCGYVKATLIHGKVSVFGYKLDKPQKSINIFGSDDFEPFVIETLPSTFENNNALLLENLSTYLRRSDIDALGSALSGNDAIIVLQELELPYKNALAYMPSGAVPVNDKSQTLFPDILQNVKLTIQAFNSDDKLFQSIDKWNEIETGKVNYVQSYGGLGKTRVAKFLINKLLTTNEAVLWLDIDCGQNEFVPPGCIALVLIKEPILGQNFCHQANILQMINVGYMNFSNVLRQYLSALNQLVTFGLQNEYKNYPWVVNTFGLFAGLGIGVAQSAIKIIQPTNVITIEHPDNKLIDELKPEAVEMEYKYCQISNGPSLYDNEKTRSMDKIWRRSVMLMSYFSSALPTSLDTFQTIEPYIIPLSKVILAVPNVPDLELNLNVLDLFSKCLVSLSDNPPRGRAFVIDGVPMMINPRVQPCMGLGIVVGIDKEKKELKIISPLSALQVGRTKLIALNVVPLPQQIFYKPIHSSNEDLTKFFRKINEEHNRNGRIKREALLVQLKPLPNPYKNKSETKENRQPNNKKPYYHRGPRNPNNGPARQVHGGNRSFLSKEINSVNSLDSCGPRNPNNGLARNVNGENRSFLSKEINSVNSLDSCGPRNPNNGPARNVNEENRSYLHKEINRNSSVDSSGPRNTNNGPVRNMHGENRSYVRKHNNPSAKENRRDSSVDSCGPRNTNNGPVRNMHGENRSYVRKHNNPSAKENRRDSSVDSCGPRNSNNRPARNVHGENREKAKNQRTELVKRDGTNNQPYNSEVFQRTAAIVDNPMPIVNVQGQLDLSLNTIYLVIIIALLSYILGTRNAHY